MSKIMKAAPLNLAILFVIASPFSTTLRAARVSAI